MKKTQADKVKSLKVKLAKAEASIVFWRKHGLNVLAVRCERSVLKLKLRLARMESK